MAHKDRTWVICCFVFINDLHDELACNVLLYADDIKIFGILRQSMIILNKKSMLCLSY